MNTRIRTTFALLGLLILSSCSGRSIDAGEDGGIAFIAMAGMLILTCVVLWFFLGRND
jgi:hypothetical protein